MTENQEEPRKVEVDEWQRMDMAAARQTVAGLARLMRTTTDPGDSKPQLIMQRVDDVVGNWTPHDVGMGKIGNLELVGDRMVPLRRVGGGKTLKVPRIDATTPASQDDWSRLDNEPAMDPESWDLDAITIEPGTLHLHDKAGGWTVSGFPEPQDAIAFMLTGDHEPGTAAEPNDYELATGLKLTWTPIH